MSTVELSNSSEEIDFTVDESINTWSSSCQHFLLRAGSYLTDPVCKMREHFYLPYIYQELYPDRSKRLKKHAYSLLMVAVCGAIAPFTAPLGALARKIASLFGPTLYIHHSHRQKIVPDGKPTAMSYNVCNMPGGYAETDGGLKPPSYDDHDRIRRNTDFINNVWQPGIACLQEVPDIRDADRISEGLNEYPFTISASGIKAIGPSSMMYVASKYEIVAESISFTPFVKDSLITRIITWAGSIQNYLFHHPIAFFLSPRRSWSEIGELVQANLPQIELTGRAASSEKGFLSFDLKDKNVTVICTHLQHSERPEAPTEDDINSRRLQMLKIARKIEAERARGRIVIFLGDLNQAESELQETLNTPEFQRLGLKRSPNVCEQSTWGGDAWCARLRGEEPSKELVLDYIFVAGAEIETQIYDVGFNGTRFDPNALSDHKPLLSKVTL